ncbi:MAG: helix-turn-helix domain-containing protein [Lentisphaerae bacterium]|nr:helix-turn-helix domain-containing protein [Lentisphaerota bacterium]MCP4103824.1 helix-turn-helix domain-containing protein [Lentisphaerota bacterium]
MDKTNKNTGLLIKDLIENANLTQKQVATKLGIAPPSLSQMIHGKAPFPTKRIKQIFDLIPGNNSLKEKIVLSSAAADILSSLKESSSEINNIKTIEAMPMRCEEMKEVPVISFAAAKSYDPALEPFNDFARDCSDETTTFSEVKEGFFALKVEGHSMSPEFPHGTKLLVAGGQYPCRGDIVVAKLSTGDVVVKKYSRKNNIIRLESENPEGQNFEWNCKEEPGYVIWMYPVMEANIDLRARRWERCKNGNH